MNTFDLVKLGGESERPLPEPPTRDDFLNSTTRLQGVTVYNTEQYGTFKAFGPEINMMDIPNDRKIYYAAQKKRGTDLLGIGWAGFTYSEPPFTYPVPGPEYRWINDLPGFCERLGEIVDEFGKGMIWLPGDGKTGVDGNPFGDQWLMQNQGKLIEAMKSYRRGDLTKYFLINAGFDGVVWVWSAEQVVRWSNALRALIPDGYIAIEYGAGINGPFGEGKEQYSLLKAIDIFYQEVSYPPESNMDQWYQIGARMRGPHYVRPNTPAFNPYLQDLEDDPGSPFQAGSGNDYLSEPTPRGPQKSKMLETLTYGYVRGEVSDETVDYWERYTKNINWE